MPGNVPKQTPMSQQFTGTIASAGLAIARARIVRSQSVALCREIIDSDDVEVEIKRFRDAREKSMLQLDAMCRKAREELGEEEAAIFEGLGMILDDEELEEEVESFIRSQLRRADFSVDKIMQENIVQLQQLEDPYLRLRAEDMEELLKRMITNLNNGGDQDELEVSEENIVIAENLSPTQTMQLDLKFVKGFVTAAGGGLSHTAILAKSLGLPAIVNAPECLEKITDGDLVVVDAAANSIIVNPDELLLSEYRRQLSQQQRVVEENKMLVKKTVRTSDGYSFGLFANIGSENDVDSVIANGADGVGLFRSEFLFMGKKNAPSEEEQFDAYRQVLERMDGKPVVLRTLDIGGDKDLPYMAMSKELNPFLGKRAIRLCFDQPELMTTQLRAAMRASAFGKLKIMFPMIISLEEVRELRSMLDRVTRELRDQQIPIGEKIEVGAMVETPAAVLMAGELIQELDFFSIGSNDLTQYLLAVDRCNSEIAHLYNPLNPAVIRAIKQVVDAAHNAGKWVGVCGEMASCQKASLVLVGLGVDELSVSSPAIPNIKREIGQYTKLQLTDLAEQVLSVATLGEIEALIDRLIQKKH